MPVTLFVYHFHVQIFSNSLLNVVLSSSWSIHGYLQQVPGGIVEVRASWHRPHRRIKKEKDFTYLHKTLKNIIL